MSFLNKSVNYSQTDAFKKDLLKPLLQMYNCFVLNQQNQDTLNLDVNTGISYDYIVSNNNKKYYMYVTKKRALDPTAGNQYDIMYFFPDTATATATAPVEPIDCDFYMEIDRLFTEDFLFEGYLYKSGDAYEYLLTDVLIRNKRVVEVSFDLRRTLLNEIFLSLGRERLVRLNNHMTINIHPIVESANETFLKIFNNNFIYKDMLCAVERISPYSKTRYIQHNQNEDIKRISKAKYSDVYDVFNIHTNNPEGILYVKGIRESQRLRELLHQKAFVSIHCKWNCKFFKWQPVFD